MARSGDIAPFFIAENGDKTRPKAERKQKCYICLYIDREGAEMAWEQRGGRSPVYTRSKRVGGKIVGSTSGRAKRRSVSPKPTDWRGRKRRRSGKSGSDSASNGRRKTPVSPPLLTRSKRRRGRRYGRRAIIGTLAENGEKNVTTKTKNGLQLPDGVTDQQLTETLSGLLAGEADALQRASEWMGVSAEVLKALPHEDLLAKHEARMQQEAAFGSPLCRMWWSERCGGCTGRTRRP